MLICSSLHFYRRHGVGLTIVCLFLKCLLNRFLESNHLGCGYLKHHAPGSIEVLDDDLIPVFSLHLNCIFITCRRSGPSARSVLFPIWRLSRRGRSFVWSGRMSRVRLVPVSRARSNFSGWADMCEGIHAHGNLPNTQKEAGRARLQVSAI